MAALPTRVDRQLASGQGPERGDIVEKVGISQSIADFVK
jgi:hypothetical protein